MGKDARSNVRSHEFGGATPTYVKDGLGRSLVVGDVVLAEKVLAATAAPLAWEVTGISPIVDPRLPANTVTLHLQATMNIPVQGGAVIPEVVRIATLAEALASKEPVGDA